MEIMKKLIRYLHEKETYNDKYKEITWFMPYKC